MKNMPHTLIINRSDSRCGNCGRNANPNDLHHDEVNDWGRISEGCHQRYVLLASDYYGPEWFYDRLKAMRPDLAWVDRWGKS